MRLRRVDIAEETIIEWQTDEKKWLIPYYGLTNGWKIQRIKIMTEGTM